MGSKELLRNEIKRRLKSLTPEKFLDEGFMAVSRLRDEPVWARYGVVLVFLSIKYEIDTEPLLEAAFSDKKKVFAPKIEQNRLCFYRLRSPAGPWEYGPFNIREPAVSPEISGSCPPLLGPADFPALIIVPGMAFDETGNRLGRGGGYYDRFFADLDRGPDEKRPPYTALGFAMETQIVAQVPAGAWDKKMDALCTAGSYRRCQAGLRGSTLFHAPQISSLSTKPTAERGY
jgi:5-formyltetrahydrofolate cyclo-ligase